MRWRVAALVALFGMAAIPAVSDATAPLPGTSIKVSVKPRSGSVRTHFSVGFRAAVSTGGSLHSLYRVTASTPGHGACQSSVSVTATPAKAGRTAHAVLAPSGSARWCAGAYRGQLWQVITQPCPLRKACPALEPHPQLVGKFTFRVTRG